MGRCAGLGADDVRLDHLLEGRAIQAAGQVVDDLLHAQVEMEGVDQVGIGRAGLPQAANDHRQEPQRPPSLLEVGDGRGLAVQRIQEFRVEGIIGHHLLGVLGPQGPLGQVSAPLHELPVEVGVRIRHVAGRFPVNLPEQAVGHDGGDLGLPRRCDHPFLAGGNPPRLGQFSPEIVALVAESVAGTG